MTYSYRAFVLISGLLVALTGCSGSDVRVSVPGGGGSGSNLGQGGDGGGTGGMGTGGETGTGGMSTGGTGGSGNDSGTGGTPATGGTGGTGNSIGGGPGFAPVGSNCNTNILCGECPTNFLCDSDDDCTFPGNFCGSSGCTSDDGLSIGRCQEPQTPACDTVDDCPNPSDYACSPVGFGVNRCLRTSPGCNPMYETIDCPMGFTCEGGSCVDRRVPCDSSLDCPKSHTCETSATARFCARVHRDCNVNEDCALVAASCADVDGDGRKECTGDLDGSPCVNSSCPGSAPVCENGDSGAGSDAVCGDYGLCRNDGDCGTGFECVELSADGRGECVPSGARGCDSSSDCAFNEVCASGRDGGTPECQAGTAF